MIFRSLADVLNDNIVLSDTDVIKIIKSPDSYKEKFILGFKYIYRTEYTDIGFRLLKSAENFDTCDYIEPSFVAELLSPKPSSFVTFGKTVRILEFILANASHTESFEMAIHQHMAQYAQSSTVETPSNIQDVLILIDLITGHLNMPTMNDEFLQVLCNVLMKKISDVQVAREPVNIQAQNLDSDRIIEFFQILNGCSRFQHICSYVLSNVYDIITRDGEVSPLTCLGLAVIPETSIGSAVTQILSMSRPFKNQKKSITNALGRLINWQSTTSFNVPLHLWVVKVMTSLYEEDHKEILDKVILDQIVRSYLTLIVPVFQIRTFQVVQVMFEIQRSEEIFHLIAPRIYNVLVHLSTNNNNEIFEQLMDVVTEYISSFPNARFVCKEVVEFLESNHRSIDRTSSKFRRLTSAGSLSNSGKIGLENLGNTCYINSVIQALFMTKSFCNELLAMDRVDRDMISVQKIFSLLLFSERSELNLKFALQQIRPIDFLPFLQHDSSEFMGSLLDKLHEADKKFLHTTSHDCDEEMPAGESAEINRSEIKLEVTNSEAAPSNIIKVETGDEDMADTPMDKFVDNTCELNQSTVVQKIFGGKISTTCVCSSCKSKSVSIDSFRDLALSFPEKEKNEDDWDNGTEYSVQELLDYYFTSEQLTLDGDNQYHCEKCKILCDGVRCTELLQSPKNLILTLKHFRYDSRYHTRSKLLINKMFHNEIIQVNVRSGQESRAVSYQLYAAVVHSGISLDSGHYYTFSREKGQVWYKFNDSYVTTSTLHELHNLNSPNTPYILFYRRISTATATASSSTACSSESSVLNEDKLPDFEELPPFLRSFVQEDNFAYRRESKKLSFQQNKTLSKSNRWNDDDPPPSSCGSSFDHPQNRFIC